MPVRPPTVAEVREVIRAIQEGRPPTGRPECIEVARALVALLGPAAGGATK